jgi:hypothetical protein
MRIHAIAAVYAILAFTSVASAPAVAQDETTGSSYINPFPENDTYRLQVYGDAFAEGLTGGLAEAFADDARVQVSRKHRVLSGLTRGEFEEDIKSEEQPTAREPVHVGVVMIGLNDRSSLRVPGGRRLALGSDEWREEYGRRVDRLMKALKRRGIAVYWVGLPILRRHEANEDAQMINDIVREKAYRNGIKYIDTQAGFADESGNYSAYGPDLSGKSRLLRESDGMLFTPAGNRKLAHFVEREIKRDLTQAQNERVIPLAGSEAEQKRIHALKQQGTAATTPSDGWKSTVSAGKGGKDRPAKGTSTAGAPDVTTDQRADHGRILLKSIGAGGREESVTIEIPRPAIPSTVVALMTRKESGDRPSQMGELVADDVGEGLVLLSSITPATVGPGGAGRRAPSSETPYYKVLVKGERLTPKPGRADDFTWPRPEPEMVVEPPRPARRVPGAPASKSSPRS